MSTENGQSHRACLIKNFLLYNLCGLTLFDLYGFLSPSISISCRNSKASFFCRFGLKRSRLPQAGCKNGATPAGSSVAQTVQFYREPNNPCVELNDVKKRHALRTKHIVKTLSKFKYKIITLASNLS